MRCKAGIFSAAILCALLAACGSASAFTVTYDIAFTSTFPPASSEAFGGSITLEAADIAAKSTTPTVDNFSERFVSFSGVGVNATYDASGNLYSIGLSNPSPPPSFLMRGHTASPNLPTWEIDNPQVPLQEIDGGTYVLTLAPEPGCAMLMTAGLALLSGRRKGLDKARQFCTAVP